MKQYIAMLFSDTTKNETGFLYRGPFEGFSAAQEWCDKENKTGQFGVGVKGTSRWVPQELGRPD